MKEKTISSFTSSQEEMKVLQTDVSKGHNSQDNMSEWSATIPSENLTKLRALKNHPNWLVMFLIASKSSKIKQTLSTIYITPYYALRGYD